MASTINAKNTSTGVVITPDASGQLELQTADTTRMTITSSGNVGIGTSSPGYAVTNRKVLAINGGTGGSEGAILAFMQGGSNKGYLFSISNDMELWSEAGQVTIGNNAASPIVLKTNNTERMRIDSSGNVLVGATSQFAGFVANAKLYTESSTADYVTHFRNTNGTAANAFGLALSYSTTPNGTSNAFLDARDSTAQRAAIRSNGGLANFSANNVNLSDGRLKTDITPAKSYLNTICSIPVVTFKYNDQTDDELNLGVIAQEVDAVAPELIDHSGFGEAPEGESPYLAVYQTDLQYALMKCIQELKAELDTVKAELAELKGTTN